MSRELFTTELTDVEWLSRDAVEVVLRRPEGFKFAPGQHIAIAYGSTVRDYSLVSADDARDLRLCIRLTDPGGLPDLLAHAEEGTLMRFSGPHGMFLYRSSKRPAVFVATGTGIAPFVSMARSGIDEFVLLHGVRTTADLFYSVELRAAARTYVPCVTRPAPGVPGPQDAYAGRVTSYVSRELAPGAYDFYLCGNQEMIGDMMVITDDRFPESRVFTEAFF